MPSVVFAGIDTRASQMKDTQRKACQRTSLLRLADPLSIVIDYILTISPLAVYYPSDTLTD